MRKMGDDDPPSLEYIEDPYYPKTETMTPSLDEEEITEFDHRSLYDDDDGVCREWSPETELYLRSLPLDQIFSISDEHEDTSDYQKAEAELGSINPNCDSKGNGLLNSSKQIKILGRLFNRQSIRDVKVTFIDFSKPYLAKISSNDNYKNFLNIGSRDGSEKLSDTSPGAASISSVDIANEFASLSSEEQDRVRAEWSQELARVEEEIATLRTVLTSKVRHASELKRKLGITVWKEISDDMNQSLKNVRESHVFQKTESAIKTTAEKTSSILGGLTSGISSKLSQMKKSDSYRSIEERVGSAYENVKTKVSTSRSGSVHSFTDENNLDSHTSTAPQSPIIPEGKSIP